MSKFIQSFHFEYAFNVKLTCDIDWSYTKPVTQTRSEYWLKEETISFRGQS